MVGTHRIAATAIWILWSRPVIRRQTAVPARRMTGYHRIKFALNPQRMLCCLRCVDGEVVYVKQWGQMVLHQSKLLLLAIVLTQECWLSCSTKAPARKTLVCAEPPMLNPTQLSPYARITNDSLNLLW